MGKLYLIGEVHNDPQDLLRIANLIRAIKPKVLGHELIYNDSCSSIAEIEDRLRGCKEGGICDPRLNKDIYELAKELNLKLTGIDVDDPSISKKSLAEQFAIRENHFIQQIDEVLKIQSHTAADVVVVVGDAHLREKATKELGPVSPLVIRYRHNPNVVIIRSESAKAEI